MEQEFNTGYRIIELNIGVILIVIVDHMDRLVKPETIWWEVIEFLSFSALPKSHVVLCYGHDPAVLTINTVAYYNVCLQTKTK